MLFKFIHTELYEHTQVRMFAGKGTGDLGFCGNLTFRNEEWKFFKDEIERTIGNNMGIGHYVDFEEEK